MNTARRHSSIPRCAAQIPFVSKRFPIPHINRIASFYHWTLVRLYANGASALHLLLFIEEDAKTTGTIIRDYTMREDHGKLAGQSIVTKRNAQTDQKEQRKLYCQYISKTLMFLACIAISMVESLQVWLNG